MSDKKKVLGINFGRANVNCKKLLSAAMEAAKQAGAETEIIDTIKLDPALYRVRSMFTHAPKREGTDSMYPER